LMRVPVSFCRIDKYTGFIILHLHEIQVESQASN
jgi:hypothetical protein